MGKNVIKIDKTFAFSFETRYDKKDAGTSLTFIENAKASYAIKRFQTRY